MNKKLLIIGGEGYIGTQLLDYLNSSDKYLTSIITSQNFTRQLL
jgi:N-acetyl-gamma-glutamylphosphate reductase